MKNPHKIIIICVIAFLFLASVRTWAANINYSVELLVTGAASAIIQWAIPENRVGAPGTNWDTTFYLTVRQASDNTLLYVMPNLATTSPDGTYLTPINMDIPAPGNFNVGIKTDQHLNKVLYNTPMYTTNTLNFTQPDNSASTGTIRLIAGDIDGAGNSTTTLGDNQINSIDLSVMLGNLDADDVTGNGLRANLNQDPVVNSVDLSTLLVNLDKIGD